MHRPLIAALTLALVFALGALAAGGAPSAIAADDAPPKCFVLPPAHAYGRKWADHVEETLADLDKAGRVRQAFLANPVASGGVMDPLVVCAVYQ